MANQYLSYAGVTLSLSTPTLEDRLNQLLPIEQFKDWDAWNFAGFDLQQLPTPSLPKAPPIELGTLHWPRDASRPSWFHAVVTDAQLQAIRNTIGCEFSLLPTTTTSTTTSTTTTSTSSTTSTTSSTTSTTTTAPPIVAQPYPLVIQDGRSGAIITAMMFMLPPRPISQFGTVPSGIAQDSWILTLVDQRFYWPWKTGSIAAIPTSWADLYNSLGIALGVTIQYDTIDPAYGTPSSKWVGYLRPLATVLDSVAAQIGQKIVVGLDGSVRALNWRTSQAAFETQVTDLSLVAGGLVPEEDVARYVPNKLAVAFANWSGPTLSPAPFTVVTNLVDLAIPDYLLQTCTGIETTAYTYADFSYDGTNTAACIDLASVISDAWYGWRLQSPDMSIPGIQPWIPTGWEDFTQWVAQVREGGPAIMTRVRRGVWDQFPSGTFTGDKTANTTTTQPPCLGSCSWSFAAMSTKWSFLGSTCPSGCGCYYPDYCPPPCTDVPNVAKTSCFRGLTNPQGPPPNCTGTTSTTTAAPGCTSFCTWKSYPVLGWVKTSDPCLPSCPCATPGSVPPSDCSTTATTACYTALPPPPPPCSGNCLWVYGDDLSWIFKSSNCSTGCNCAPPANTPTCGTQQFTPCVGPPSILTSTTSPPGNCVGRCFWCWTGSTWSFKSTECVGCLCPAPIGSGTTAGEVGITSCTSVTTSTTSTTTSTTSTTTTASNCYSNYCNYVCTSHVWVVTGCGCTASCGCANLNTDPYEYYQSCISGDIPDGSVATANCFPPPYGSIACTTTTTAAPSSWNCYGCVTLPATRCAAVNPDPINCMLTSGPYANCPACSAACSGAAC